MLVRRVSTWRLDRSLALPVFIALVLPTYAQESLDTILDRGYVTQWLVCGPFPADVEGGIVAAVKRGQSAAGPRDFMAPVGGIARLRPKDGLRVATGRENGGGVALWRGVRAEDASLDLASLFTGRGEGVAYGAFYARARERRGAYLDVQTPLGARVYLNGFPVCDIHPVPVNAGGVDRFLVTFREGLNLLVIEAPVAAFDALAEAAGMSAVELRTRGFVNCPLLKGLSGFEIGLRVLPVAEFAGIAYVPRLHSTGAFSGHGAELRQDAVLTLFNPATEPSPPFIVQAVVSEGGKPLRQIVSPVPPHTERQAVVSIPVGETVPGQAVTVQVTLEHETETARFTTAVNVLPPARRGTVYVVTGRRHKPPEPEDQAAETARRLAEFRRNLVVLDSDPKYGFDLGGVAQWKPILDVNPQAREAVRQAVGVLRCGAQAGYGTPDERIVGGEVLVRNLAYGAAAVERLLGDSAVCYYAWDTPAVSPQTPQLLADAGILGLVSNLHISGLAELFWHEAPDGSRVIHRRKQPSTGPNSVIELRQAAMVQRRELLERGLDTDILVTDSLVPPPEPFYLGACTALTRSIPSIVVSGAGGREFMETTVGMVVRDMVDIPVTARAMNTYQPGALATQPNLKRAYGEIECLLLSAEKFATFAALLGATYPEPALDLAWRQLLYAASSYRVGFAATPRVYLDTLAALREAAELAGGVLHKATAYVAEQVDTYSDAPPESEELGLAALVVFNPCSWTRTDVCETELALTPGVAGLTVLDEAGAPVPFLADHVQRLNARIVRADIRFLARDVPALGYKTYYLQPRGQLPKPDVGPGAQIENEFLCVLVDPVTGAIAGLVAKDSGEQYASDMLNAVAAIEEDVTNNAHGRELWTTSGVIQVGPGPAELVLAKTGWMQQLTVTVPFGEGVVIRRLTLYNGIPRLDCVICFEGVRTEDRLLVVTFALDGSGRAPIFGERFGALVGRKSRGVLDFRTQGMANPSGTAAQPALRWAALSPNDHIEAGLDIAVPFLPCAVIHGQDGLLERAAREIQTALVGRGIPAATWPDVTRKLNPIWTDSTECPNFNDDLDHGTAMRIIVGSQEQNVFCRHLCLRMPPDAVIQFNERLTEGTTLFLFDRNVPEGYSPVPTLILAGHTSGGTAAMARSFAKAVATHGVFSMSPLGYLPEHGQPQPDTGLAILHPGAALRSIEQDGTMVLLLAHGSRWEDTGEGYGDVDRCGDISLSAQYPHISFRYALYPFSGTWRDAGVVRAAHAYNEPLIAAMTTLHLGAYPSRLSFLTPEHLGFVITAVKPAGYALASMSGKAPQPCNGIAVRGYESLGRTWQADMVFFAPVREAATANLLDEGDRTLAVEANRVTHPVGACSVETILVLPSARITQGPPTELGPAVGPYGPAFTRYWRHNRGAAPLGFQPLSVLLRGRLAENDAAAEVVVANNTSDEIVSGTVFVSASEGWSIAPTQFDYALRPGECQRQEVAVLRNTGSATTGGLVARTSYRGQSYQDILELDTQPLYLEVTRSGGEIKATVHNRGALAAEGYLEVIAPPAYWPELARGHGTTIAPGRVAVAVPPFKRQDLVFLLSDPRPPAWLVAKLAANGHVVYARISD